MCMKTLCNYSHTGKGREHLGGGRSYVHTMQQMLKIISQSSFNTLLIFTSVSIKAWKTSIQILQIFFFVSKQKKKTQTKSLPNVYQEKHAYKRLRRYTHTQTTLCTHKHNSLDYQCKLQKLSIIREETFDS